MNCLKARGSNPGSPALTSIPETLLSQLFGSQIRKLESTRQNPGFWLLSCSHTCPSFTCFVGCGDTRMQTHVGTLEAHWVVPQQGSESGWEARCPFRHGHPDTNVVFWALPWFLIYVFIFWIVMQTNFCQKCSSCKHRKHQRVYRYKKTINKRNKNGSWGRILMKSSIC